MCKIVFIAIHGVELVKRFSIRMTSKKNQLRCSRGRANAQVYLATEPPPPQRSSSGNDATPRTGRTRCLQDVFCGPLRLHLDLSLIHI